MLSLMDTNRAKDESLTIPERKDYVKSANSRLAKAFQIDPKNSLCNTQMALKMIERDAKKAKTMSTSALLYTKNSTLRANAHLINGRIAHSEGLYKEAFENYKAAAEDDPNSTVIQFYLGLLYIEKGF
jgi:tetratricopeptide (TPR) repeat protein